MQKTFALFMIMFAASCFHIHGMQKEVELQEWQEYTESLQACITAFDELYAKSTAATLTFKEAQKFFNFGAFVLNGLNRVMHENGIANTELLNQRASLYARYYHILGEKFEKYNQIYPTLFAHLIPKEKSMEIE